MAREPLPRVYGGPPAGALPVKTIGLLQILAGSGAVAVGIPSPGPPEAAEQSYDDHQAHGPTARSALVSSLHGDCDGP